MQLIAERVPIPQGWDLAEGYMPGMQAAMEAAGAIRFNIITQGKEARSWLRLHAHHLYNALKQSNYPSFLCTPRAFTSADSGLEVHHSGNCMLIQCHPAQSVNGITAYTPHAKGDLTNYLASRALIERVMREKLLDAHANIDVRWANPAAGLQHGVGDDKGCITGAQTPTDFLRTPAL